jgi:two-component system sensor histidine kinase AlgZ
VPTAEPLRAIASDPESRAERIELYSGLVPREMFWVALLLPALAAYIFSPESVQWDWELGVRAITGSMVPFVFITSVIYLLYRWVMPRWLARLGSDARRGAAHALVAVGGSALLGLVLVPFLSWFRPEMVDVPARFVVICASIGAALILPVVMRTQSVRRQRELKRRLEAERRVALEAELRALQARTNPHFLFNAINTVASLIPSDPELAEDTLTRLADLVRYALESSDRQRVSLAAELEIVRDYLEIQSRRFGDRMGWSIDVDPAVDPAGDQIPPLSLQPLVENAVLHGVGGASETVTITVSIARAGGDLVCGVRDDGAGLGSSHAGSGTSTRDLAERLRILYGRGDLLTSRAGDKRGWVTSLRIPPEVVSR